MQKLLRIKDVLGITGLSRSGLYEKISSGLFPRPVQLGPRSVAWIDSEIDSWIKTCIQQSRTTSNKQVKK